MLNNHPLQLWFARTDTASFAELWDKHASDLPQQEKEKVLSYKFDKDRILSLVSKVMLRTMLTSHFPGKDPKTWQFTTNYYGKPFIAENDQAAPLYFNLSHTEGLVACAVSINGDVGVDVETLNSRETILEIAPSVFTPNELDALSGKENQIQYFYRLWTLKEAYIKHQGKGLSIPLQDFEFTLRDRKIEFRAIDNKLIQHVPSFVSTLFQPRHMLSIALQPGRADSIVIHTRDFSDLKNARPINIQFDLYSTNIDHLLSG